MTESTSENTPQHDVFLSHASEDKAEFVDPLRQALQARGLRVWYDAHQIRMGDDFRKKMDEGLARLQSWTSSPKKYV